MRIKKLEEELDRLRDRGDAESGRTVDLKAQLDSAKEQVAHYQDETRRLDRDVTRLTGQKAEHDLIVKRLGRNHGLIWEGAGTHQPLNIASVFLCRKSSTEG